MRADVMNRERRLEALGVAAGEAVVSLADRVLQDLDVSVSRGPQVGLLMVRVEEPSERLPFNFTEVTVSEAEVTAGGHRGYAIVMGRDPEKALAAAILDAALEAGHPASKAVEEMLEGALAAEQSRSATARARISPTHVKFEEMAP